MASTWTVSRFTAPSVRAWCHIYRSWNALNSALIIQIGRTDTHCIIVTVADRDALNDYMQHPAHQPVAEALVAALDTIKVMDVEF